MTEPPVLVTRDGAVATIALNRPDQRNALDAELADALADALRRQSDDPSIRAIVLTATGSAFCAGARLDALLAASERGDAAGVAASFGVVERVYRALLAVRPPIVAAVAGPALAGGGGIVTACDFAIAAEDASFGFPEIRLGLTPGMVLTLLVPRIGGRAALDLALTGRRIGAAEAARLGLVNEVVPPDRLAERALALARQLATYSPTAVAATKRWTWTLADTGRLLDQGRDLSTVLAMSDDARAGMRAFFARPAPGRAASP